MSHHTCYATTTATPTIIMCDGLMKQELEEETWKRCGRKAMHADLDATKKAYNKREKSGQLATVANGPSLTVSTRVSAFAMILFHLVNFVVSCQSGAVPTV